MACELILYAYLPDKCPASSQIKHTNKKAENSSNAGTIKIMRLFASRD